MEDQLKRFEQLAVDTALIETTRDGEASNLFIGVPKDSNHSALEEIRKLLPLLSPDDVAAVLHTVVREAPMPRYKHEYLNGGGTSCPFCQGEVEADTIEADGMMAWSRIICRSCGRSWQDVYTVIDMVEVCGPDGKELDDAELANFSE